jgi:hypothetical protein
MELSRSDGSVIAVEVAGERGAVPVLLCHGLADSRLSAQLFPQAARELDCASWPRTDRGPAEPILAGCAASRTGLRMRR